MRNSISYALFVDQNWNLVIALTYYAKEDIFSFKEAWPMWIRSFRIIKQTNRDTYSISLFELTLNKGMVRYHATVHKKQLTERDFEQNYHIRGYYDYKYHTLKQAEHLYDMMIQSDIEIKVVDPLEKLVSMPGT